MDELTYVMAESNRRARWGRMVARWMFALAVALVVVALALLAASPEISITAGKTSITVDPQRGWQLALLGFAVGLFWMWRIVPADPDARSPRHLQRR